MSATKRTSIRNQTEVIVQEFFCHKASCSKKVKKDSSDNNKGDKESDKDEEIDNLKQEIERLKRENSELRKEIARLKGNDDSGLWNNYAILLIFDY